ncbi:hypothetical protein FACS18945_5770 [Bacteroidia bacterium]|nr:hypothetical protein FACS189434_11110 [Bacteroidia bacterium]GHT59574.1 hypothetical protein FACS18945_5770 [Bacteroidia bacterium]
MEDDFKKRMYALDEIGFIGNPRRKHNEKDRFMFSGIIRAARDFRTIHLREMTSKELLLKGKELERTYNCQLFQNRKDRITRQMAAAVL